MQTPKLNVLGGMIGRKLSRRTTVKYVAGTGMATAALAFADRARAALTAGLPAQPSREEPATSPIPSRTRRGSRLLSKVEPVNAIEQLSALVGVALAVEWTPDGTLIDFETRADVSRDLAVNAAQYGAAVSAMAPGLADAYSRTTGFAWAPYRAVVVCGGEWAAVVGSDNTGVWVKAAQADFNHLIAAMSAGERDPALRGEETDRLLD